MHPGYYLSPLAVALALGLVSPVKSAQPMLLQKTSMAQLKQKFQISLPGLVQGASVSKDSLHFLKKHTDTHKVAHVRMQQYYAGFPVFGGYAVFHSPYTEKQLISAQSGVRMNGTLFQGLQAELGQVPPSFVSDAGGVLQQFKRKYAGKELGEEQVNPMVYVDEKQQGHWAYKVSVLVNHKDSIPERPTAIVDAKTHQILMQWNDIKTAKVLVKGTGFGGNDKTGELQYGKGLPLLTLTRDDESQTCFMENAEVKVIDMLHQYRSKKVAMNFPCKAAPDSAEEPLYFTGYHQDGYDKENGASSPTNDALYFGYVIKHMYRDWYKLDALENPDGSPMRLVMRVHYGESYENAYWDGKTMTFGDGSEAMYPLVSLGIASHEISHGFTENYSDLEYFAQSGGINEAFSDMAAQAAEFYATGKNDWSIGAEIMKEASGLAVLRYMDKPSRDGFSIDSADQYYYGMDVHFSSGVYNRLFYLLSNQPNWTVRKAFDVMIKANMDYWTPNTGFDEAGCGLISAAKDLNYSIDDVKKSLDEVAVRYEDCSAD